MSPSASFSTCPWRPLCPSPVSCRNYAPGSARSALHRSSTKCRGRPARKDEAANAQPLIESEEARPGNNIESLSSDAIGDNGAVLNALSDLADGPQVTVYVPPKEQPPRDPEFFQPDAFRLPEAGDELTCPNRRRRAHLIGIGSITAGSFASAPRSAETVRYARNASRQATTRGAKSARTIFKRSAKRRGNVRGLTSTTGFAKNILESNES